MGVLPFVVMGAEIATVLAIVLYASVLASMDREADTIAHELPRLDDVSRSLQAAAKYGFRFGTLAVILASVFLGGLT